MMAQDGNNTGLKIRRWDADEVYLMVNDPMRRRIIRAFANGGWKMALELGVGPGNKRHTLLKHFKVLCKAGILVQKENPNDLRQPLYALVPSVVVCQTEDA
ncbi:MAG: hypothetical protein JWM68_5644, partial [Verrucomicrobiales bacterium]|nr:hypothetical protein [Verrucomicrobiales bacterium]